MSRLAKEIRTYQMILSALQNCKETQDMSEFCASLKISEKTCFKFLEAALIGGVLFWQIARKLDEHFAKMLILAGKGKLILSRQGNKEGNFDY
ncbi:MAG TPA: hypothetical protein GXX46_11070 [Peptococcaceae bacterium]|nr:hypothetical protein [Peptococcaceae bacterium]